MLSLRLLAILAFSAIASSTSNKVDCEVTTDFQDPSLPAAVLSGTIGVNNKLPMPYRGANWDPTFRVFQSTSAQNLANPNKFIYVGDGADTTVLARLSADTAGGFAQLKLEQYATYCLARTQNSAVVYLMDCTVDVLDSSDLSKPPFDSYRFQTTQRVDLPALKDDDFLDPHNVTNPPLIRSAAFRVTYHPDRLAELLGGIPANGYGFVVDNIVYGLKRSPGSTVPCPRAL